MAGTAKGLKAKREGKSPSKGISVFESSGILPWSVIAMKGNPARRWLVMNCEPENKNILFVLVAHECVPLPFPVEWIKKNCRVMAIVKTVADLKKWFS